MRIVCSVATVGPELELNKFLGKGSFGSVTLIKYKGSRDGETLYAAVKTSNENHAESLYREFEILSEFKGCPRIVQCYGTKVQDRINRHGDIEFKLPMEYASGGSLRSFMDRFKDSKLPDPLIRRFTRMILEGLATIHGHGYVHCDLKPENILVFPSFELKISDFGLSKRDGDSSWWNPYSPFAGTPIYMSPASISHGETRRGLDLWSLGCVVLEMYTGKRPYCDTNYDLEDLKKCNCMPLIPSDIPCDAKLFVMSCFASDIDKRRNAFTLLKNCFLRRDVRKIIEPLVKERASNEIALELEKIERRLSQLRSIGGGKTRGGESRR